MALWKCKQCGDKVSTKADACPFCGAKRRRRHPVIRALVAIFTVIVLWLWISSLFLDDRYSRPTITGPPKTSESEGEPNVASAAVRTDSLSLSIQNLDTFDWSSLRVFLNGTPGWMPMRQHMARCCPGLRLRFHFAGSPRRVIGLIRERWHPPGCG